MAKDIETRVKELVIKSLGLEEPSLVTSEAFFVEDLGADSFGIVTLVTEIDVEFGVQIPTEDIQKIKTVNDAIEYIKARVKN